VISAIVVASIATTMIIIGYFGLPLHQWQGPIYNASQTGYKEDVDYIYDKPYTRIIPFVMGIALGYLFATRPVEKASGKNPLVTIIGWTVSLALAVPFLFGYHFNGGYSGTVPVQEMTLGSRVFYGGLQRFGWSLVVGWILFACQYGYGGPVRDFLGSRFWRPLSNLTYGMYLIHMLTVQLYFASQRHMVFYSALNFVTIFVAQLVFAYGVALLMAILVEIPLLRLERLVIRRTL